MLNPTTNSKITNTHLDKQALIYVRQSTLLQVRHNSGSTARQYDLKQRAIELGWSYNHIQIIDQDLGQSGASIAHRDGFQWLVAEVGLGHAGAVLCLEASRLARSCSDWYRLLEICALSGTLVIDEEGIYDPAQYNDRLLLGFKGTMSEAELHWLHQRMHGGKVAKAQKGELRQPLPTGLVYDLVGKIVLDPDEQVVNAFRLVFSLFEQFGSALAVTRHFNAQGLKFPTRTRSTQSGELSWEPLEHSRVRAVLHNPFYAGAYVYGQIRQTKTVQTQSVDTATSPKKHLTRLKPADWPIVLLEHHPGYISWEQYLRNLKQLDQNRTYHFDQQMGAVREGAALLQGLVHCGKCGKRLRVAYRGKSPGPVYVCNEQKLRLGSGRCQEIRGDGIDEAVAQAFLQALQPAQLEISLAVLEQLEVKTHQFEQQWKLSLERADYEAQLARRRFMAVEPENRLVARTLEQEWNEKLAELAKLQEEYKKVSKLQVVSTPLSKEERERILQLAQNVPAIWSASSTSQTERKQLLRFLIKSVRVLREGKVLKVDIWWQSEAHSFLELPAPVLSRDKYRSNPKLVELIGELALEHTDQQILEVLNEQGWQNAHGKPLNIGRIRGIRRDYGISAGSPERPGRVGVSQRGDGRYSVKAVAKMLKVDPATINEWCRAGKLDNMQLRPGGTRWIKLSVQELAELNAVGRGRPKKMKS